MTLIYFLVVVTALLLLCVFIGRFSVWIENYPIGRKISGFYKSSTNTAKGIGVLLFWLLMGFLVLILVLKIIVSIIAIIIGLFAKLFS